MLIGRTASSHHPQDIGAYTDGKDDFIQETESRAFQWLDGQRAGSVREAGRARS